MRAAEMKYHIMPQKERKMILVTEHVNKDLTVRIQGLYMMTPNYKN